MRDVFFGLVSKERGPHGLFIASPVAELEEVAVVIGSVWPLGVDSECGRGAVGHLGRLAPVEALGRVEHFRLAKMRKQSCASAHPTFMPIYQQQQHKKKGNRRLDNLFNRIKIFLDYIYSILIFKDKTKNKEKLKKELIMLLN